MDKQGNVWMALENTTEYRELCRFPHVVLIAEGDPIARAAACGLEKILGVAKVGRIALDEHGKRGRPGEALDDFKCPIGRAIVADYEFARRVRLRDEAVELLLKEPFAIVSGHRYRNSKFLHQAALAIVPADVKSAVGSAGKFTGNISRFQPLGRLVLSGHEYQQVGRSICFLAVLSASSR
jgi:hypothetical protein